VTVSAESLTGVGFSVSGAVFPVTLDPTIAITVQVQFNPTVAGSASGTLQFSSNSTSGATSTVNLSGNGTALQHKVSLNWVAPASSSVGGYNIYRATGSNSTYQLLSSSSSTSYVDSSVQANTGYSYYVTSVASAGSESAPSNQVTVTVPK
jgi:fibronectin type 3 domain-containing protein